MARSASKLFNADSRQTEQQEVLAIEIGVQVTKAISLQRMAHSTVVRDYHVEESLIPTESTREKIAEKNIASALARLNPQTRKITLIINDATAFSVVHRVPVSTEEGIRNHIKQTFLQNNKVNLDQFFWSVLPLNNGADAAGVTEAAFNKSNVLICGTKKDYVDKLVAWLTGRGYSVQNILFQVPCLIKAFQTFGGPLFEKQTVALLHLNHSKYGLALIKNGGLIAHRESKFNRDLSVKNHHLIQQDVRATLLNWEAKYKTEVKCIFVSGDYMGNALFINELREHGCYARPWAAIKKIPNILPESKKEQLGSDAAQLNIVLGAAISAAESSETGNTVQPADAEEPSAQKSAVPWLTRPFAIAACVLLLVWGILQNQTTRVEKIVKAQAAESSKVALTPLPEQAALAQLEAQVNELRGFSQARIVWSPVVAQLKEIQVSGVELMQVKASDAITISDPNPFSDEAKNGPKRKNTGNILIEARNDGGLTSLESFMVTVKTNDWVKPLLNKKRPMRLVNNVSTTTNSNAGIESSQFTVEYALDEKTF